MNGRSNALDTCRAWAPDAKPGARSPIITRTILPDYDQEEEDDAHAPWLA